MMTHSCEDHGHFCSICENERLDRERWRVVRITIESWNWNLSIFEIYDFLKDLSEDQQFMYFAAYHAMYGRSSSDCTKRSVAYMAELCSFLVDEPLANCDQYAGALPVDVFPELNQKVLP